MRVRKSPDIFGHLQTSVQTHRVQHISTRGLPTSPWAYQSLGPLVLGSKCTWVYEYQGSWVLGSTSPSAAQPQQIPLVLESTSPRAHQSQGLFVQLYQKRLGPLILGSNCHSKNSRDIFIRSTIPRVHQSLDKSQLSKIKLGLLIVLFLEKFRRFCYRVHYSLGPLIL